MASRNRHQRIEPTFDWTASGEISPGFHVREEDRIVPAAKRIPADAVRHEFVVAGREAGMLA